MHRKIAFDRKLDLFQEICWGEDVQYEFARLCVEILTLFDSRFSVSRHRAQLKAEDYSDPGKGRRLPAERWFWWRFFLNFHRLTVSRFFRGLEFATALDYEQQILPDKRKLVRTMISSVVASEGNGTAIVLADWDIACSRFGYSIQDGQFFARLRSVCSQTGQAADWFVPRALKRTELRDRHRRILHLHKDTPASMLVSVDVSQRRSPNSPRTHLLN